MRRLRPSFGTAALLAAALATCAVSLGQALQFGPDYRNADILADYDGPRLLAVRSRLPPFTPVKYVCDNPSGDGRVHDPAYVTQYSITPAVVLIDDPPQKHVLLDGRPGVEPDLGAKPRLLLEYDAGNGVRLYRVEEP